jgi:hypothetical protein
MKRKPSFSYQIRALVVVATFFGVMAAGLVAINQLGSSKDLAFAQSAPANPTDPNVTTVIPGVGASSSSSGSTTSISSSSGQTPQSSGATPPAPSSSSSGASASTGVNTGDQTPPTPTAQTEMITSTGQTTVSTGTSSGTVTPVAGTTFTQDNTVRSGGLEFALAGVAIIALGLGYYYYHKRGNTKHSLKMDEKKIKKTL